MTLRNSYFNRNKHRHLADKADTSHGLFDLTLGENNFFIIQFEKTRSFVRRVRHRPQRADLYSPQSVAELSGMPVASVHNCVALAYSSLARRWPSLARAKPTSYIGPNRHFAAFLLHFAATTLSTRFSAAVHPLQHHWRPRRPRETLFRNFLA